MKKRFNNEVLMSKEKKRNTLYKEFVYEFIIKNINDETKTIFT